MNDPANPNPGGDAKKTAALRGGIEIPIRWRPERGRGAAASAAA
jgi:hypothetical protein